MSADTTKGDSVELVPGVWISSGRQNGKTAKAIAAAVAAARPVHYREAADSLDKLADALEATDPTNPGIGGIRLSAIALRRTAPDLEGDTE